MTEAAPVIHICGFPGSGKQTIGACLAERTGGRLLHNHLALEPASALFDRADTRHAALREELRALIYKSALKLSPDITIVVTDALQDTPRDHALFAPTVDLAKARGSLLKSVTLTISGEENRRRLVSPARAQSHKLTNTKILDHLRETCHLLKPEGAIDLEVTNLSAHEAADEIVRKLNLTEVITGA